MNAVRVALSLGSNVGERENHLANAVSECKGESNFNVRAVSRVAETTPVGGPPQPDYLNLVLVADTLLTPLDVLALARRCEAAAGRQRAERWGPRTLDVDVLAYGALEQAEPELILPHPRAVERAFVILPWSEIDPEFVVSGRTVQEWARDLDSAGVRFVGPLRMAAR
jgi:2-amino-4-hydroxy-6-hydroxymethyldihydropteridine diphosphokinase